ncbi:MAG: ChaB family protein [Gammaproteobacteria bacterium]|nr:ChaB family protein [Gammaproteobacteria bacterium]MDH4316217.1 ChaB family protein [Gammaproteobacteria bacterium]MDH5215631.1 ChaB family protein [Gammaproteobacteria bacterium]
MPYRTLAELPTAVREHLPVHAQEIYLRAFNNAWEQYKDPRKRRKKGSREETAHRVAWGAVERNYEKGGSGKWRRISS